MKILNSLYFWIILLLILIAPLFFLSFFVYPSADDYSVFNLTQQHGYFAYQKYIYLNWTGRYSANFLEALNPLRCIIIYRMIPPVLLTLLFLSGYYFFCTLLNSFLKKQEMFLFSLVFFVLYINTFPSTGEGIYWYPAGVEYLLANAFTLFFLAILIRIIHSPRKHKIPLAILLILLAFVIIGLNEISMVLICGILLLFWSGSTYVNRKISITMTLVLVYALVFAFAEILAPGNYVRMSVFSGSMNYVQSIISSCIAVAKMLGLHFQSPPFVLLTIIVIPFIVQVIRKNSIRYRYLINPWVLSVFSLLTLVVLYIPGFLSMGINPPVRVHALISFVFMMLWFINMVNLCHFFVRKKITIPVFPDILKRILLVCIVLFAISDFFKEPGGKYYFRNNITRAYYDLFFKVAGYKTEMESRYIKIKEATNTGNLDLQADALQSIPQTIFFTDIQSDTSYWINRDYAEYYSLKTIAIKK
ncbi:MAG TPA: DUF6056 family protein [Bacteroidales bacterium]|nr:DUF6056 family protein [Bacteroidales bacterium]